MRRQAGRVPMAAAPWIVSDELWEMIEPLLPKRERSRRGGRRRHPDRQTLSRILFVLHTGIPSRHLPAELGLGVGVPGCRRVDEWQRAGGWERLHVLLLERLRAACQNECTRAVVDASHVQAKRGAARRARAQLIVDDWAPNTT